MRPFAMMPSSADILLGLFAFRKLPLLPNAQSSQKRRLRLLDALTVFSFALSIPAIGLDRSDALWGVFNYATSELVLGLLMLAVIARLCVAYPHFMLTAHANLIETLRSRRRSDAFWLGILLT